MAALSLVLPVGTAWAAPGDLDPTFGGDGRVISDSNPSGVTEEIMDLALQPADGKILAAVSDGTLARYTPNGAPDSGFGSGGRSPVSAGAAPLAPRAVAAQPGGKILVGGMAFTSNSWNFTLARYNPDGTPDTTFGANGATVTAVSAAHDEVTSMAVAPDGKVVLAGFTQPDLTTLNIALARYNADGTPDTGFDGDGVLISALPSTNSDAKDVAVQPDGKTVVATSTTGASGAEMTLVRYNLDGSLDQGFDADGIAKTDFAGSSDTANALALLPDGDIVAAGTANTAPGNGDEDFALARFNPDGSLDTGFDDDGKVKTDVGDDPSTGFSSFDRANDLAIRPDGKLVVAGTAEIRPPGTTDRLNDFALVRYEANGALDTTFGDDGKVTTDFGAPNDIANALALQPDGRAVAGGKTANEDLALARYLDEDPPPADTDGDGVPDTSDACPARPAPGTANGCPPASPPAPNTAPVISGVKPAPGAKVRDATPQISVKVTDRQTNLNRANVRLYLDGKRVARFSYNTATDRLAYQSRKLKPGRYTVRVVANDGRGKVGVKTWSFKVIRK